MTPLNHGRALRAAGLLAVAALLFGCAAQSGTAPTATATPTSDAAPTPTPTPTPTLVASPLVGTLVPESSLTGPALSAKIDNHWDARPQIGLERTDLIFEELVEGGLTRYVAVWYSDVPAEIGPVRSIRPMDPDIISPLGGIVAYSGGRSVFVNMMRNTDVHNAIHGGADDRYMYRTTAKAAPHNVIVKAKDLRAAYDDIASPQTHFSFAVDAAYAGATAFGTAAKGVDTVFSPASSRSWRWDAGRAQYLRSQDGRKDTDAQGTQLGATNVIAMSVAIDWTYGYIPKTVMVGSGTAWISAGGKTLEARWSKKSRTAPIVFTRTNGLPIYLAEGNTWIELVPESGSIKVVP